MKKFIPVLLVLALAGAAYAFLPQRASAPVRPASVATEDSCQGKQRCVVAYLAPWCPHCKKVVPDLQRMVQKSQSSQEAGMRIVVGAGEPGENEALAKAFGAAGVVDATNEIANRLRCRHSLPSSFWMARAAWL